MNLSVIVRARDEATELERGLRMLATQTVPYEVIVVDSGSLDDTLLIAERAGARVVRIAAHEFTYGGALNGGCAEATGEILVALSAHAHPADGGWLARVSTAFDDSRVACASGDIYGPDAERLDMQLLQDVELARRRPEWGYSNAAGAFRAELWRRRPFRTDLPASEDKEWALHWLEQGYVCAVDPALVVEHDHTHDPVRSIYARARREWEAAADFHELPPYGPADLTRDWWSDLRWYHSATRARLSHRRLARLLGAYAGRRAGVRRRAG